MKRVWKSSISVLLTVLMVCSMITVTLPMSVGAESAATSKWSAGSGASVLSESSVTWVTDTVTVNLKSINGYVQLDQILTELIGSNGADGRAYVQIFPEEHTTVFALLQLVGTPDATGIDPVSDSRAMSWYIRSNETPTFSTIHLRGKNDNRTYGYYADFAEEGYMFGFTQTASGNVAIRGIGEKTGTSFDSYADTTVLNSVKTLAQIEGAGEKTGEDGVYFRLQNFTSTSTNNQKYTIKVVYPKPAVSTVNGSKDSRWTAGGGAEILSETHEAMVYDTVRVNLAAEPGFVQHHVKLTDLIGSNGADGKGYIHIIPDDATNDFSFVQLVGNPSITGTVDPNYTSTQGLTWYFRSNENMTYPTVSIRGINSHVIYGNYTDFADEGYMLAFSQNDTGNVMIRGIGEKTGTAFDSYTDTAAALASRKTLSEIQGVGTETAEEGVYFRLQSFGGSARNQTHTIHIVYPDSEDLSEDVAIPPIERVNLVPDDIFASYANMADWFKGALNTDASYYTVENGEYVAQLPRKDNWTYSVRIPSGEFTAEFDVCPIAKDNGSLAAIGVMIGTNSGGGFPWFNAQIQFRTADGVSFAKDGIYAQHWYHSGVTEGTHSKIYTSEPLFTGSEYVTTPKWYKIRIEIGKEQSKMYVDGVLMPEGLLGYMPTADEAQYIGFWPEGSSNGFKIKNYKLYEGLPDNLIPEDVFAGNTQMSQVFGGAVSTDSAHYTVENGDYVYYAPTQAATWPYTTMEFPDGSFTVKMKIKPTTYVKDNVTKYSGMGILLGYGTGTGFPWVNVRFDVDYDTKKVLFYVWENLGSASINPSYGTTWYQGELPEDMWFEAVFEFTNDETRIYLDGYRAPTFTSTNAQSLGHIPQADELKYIGWFPSGSGQYIKDLELYEGVTQIRSAAPELDEAITLHMQAEVDSASTDPVWMKFNFKGETIWEEGVLSGDQYTFALPDILPQDMNEKITADLYVGSYLKDRVVDYSLKQYCMNMLPSAEDAAADTSGQKQKLRDVLIAMLNYGTESQKYFEGVTDATLFANSQLDAGEKTSVNQAMTNAGSVRSVGTRSDANNYWKSASLALFNTVRLRFKFVTNDASKITIKVGETTYDNFELSTGNIYYWDYDGVYAHQFDTPVVVGLYVDGVLVQEVTYSINSYVNAFVAANDESSKSYALIQAVYDYGCAASAYNA